MRIASSIGTALVVLALSCAPAAALGALAVGSCGAFGYAYDYEQVAEARTSALANCPGQCTLVADLSRTCAALAIDLKRPCGAHGWAVANRLGQAQNNALRQCYRHGGQECVIRTFVCDSR
jgi:hypothetical protein